MSLAAAVNAAVKSARQGLGDLVTKITLRRVVSETYNAAEGRYVPVHADRSVDMVPDKFSFNELNDSDYKTTDIKILIFNPDNDIEISTLYRMVLNGIEYGIRKADPTYVGGFVPVWTVILKK